MAHLVLVSEAKAEVEVEREVEAEARLPEWDLEQGPEEQRPLLGGEASCTRSQLQEFSSNHSLIPDASLPAQVRRVQSVKHEDLNSFFFSEGASFLPSYLPHWFFSCFPDPGLPAPADLQRRLCEAAGVSEAFWTVPPPSPSPEEPLQQRPLLLVPVRQQEDPSLRLEKQRRGLQTNRAGRFFMCPSEQRTCGSVSAADSSSASCLLQKEQYLRFCPADRQEVALIKK